MKTTNSPVEDLLIQLVSIDKKSKTPIYLQVAEQMVKAIQQGYFADTEMLPGTRTISKLLKLHRNTVVAVFEELASQGWVNIVANKGTFIQHQPKITSIKKNTFSHYPQQTAFTFYENTHLISPYEKTETLYTFNDGQTDMRLHADTQYNRWYNAALNRTGLIKKWNTFLFDRASFLNIQLSNYLNATKHLSVKPEHILVTRNTEMSLYLVAQLLIKPNDVVLVGSLSNFAANMIFHQAKANIKTIPIDEKGLDVDFIKKHFTKNSIRAVYCTPNRHYPTTYSLSADRKIQLLELAQEYGFAIIEDDYDSDFEFDALIQPSLLRFDAKGSVIYLGKVGQTLFPAFETGFIIAPVNFINEARNYYKMIDSKGDLIKEQILAEVIYEGELHRQQKKKVLLYKERYKAMCHALDFYFNDLITYHKPNGGLALFVQFKTPIALGKLAQQLKNYNVGLPKYLLYQTKTVCGIRLGFGHLNLEEIGFTVQMLKKAYDDLHV